MGRLLRCVLFALALLPVLVEVAGTRCPGGLELVYSYLDDLCLAGEASAVAAAVNTLQARCATMGLQLSTGAAHFQDKCEVILAGGQASTVDTAHSLTTSKSFGTATSSFWGGRSVAQTFATRTRKGESRRRYESCRLWENFLTLR